MIVFINGPFGVGKTTSAARLVERIIDCIVFDPEEIGTMLARALGRLHPVDDFQDYPLWRTLFVQVVLALHDAYGGTILVPMTILRHDYFREVVDALQSRAEVRVVCLIASRDVLTERIRKRPENEGSHAWCLSHIDSAQRAFSDERLGIRIDSSSLDESEVADAIMLALRAISATKTNYGLRGPSE